MLFRWTEDAVTTKLKPAFEELLDIRGITRDWDAKEKAFTFSNGSKVWMFGLKAVSQIELFNKIRGLGVCRIMGDQVEEMDRGVAGELRGRLRPNLTATLAARTYPFQLTFIANPEDHDFWLAKEFPLDNRIKGRKVYSLSIFDNYHLPKESAESLLRQYPPDHPKHLTMVLGQRGPNVIGDAVFEGLYRKDLHWRSALYDPALPLWESFHCGTHNPTWVITQPMQGTGLTVLAGVRGEGLMLEDFCGIVKMYRSTWFPPTVPIQTCVAPMGASALQHGRRFTPLDVIRQKFDVSLLSRANGNDPDVRLAMIEHLASLLRSRNARGEESLCVNTDLSRFVIASREEMRESSFVHHAFEAGFVWDEHFVSIENKNIRQSREDDKFANAMHCLENICLNFCVGQNPGQAERDAAMRHALLGPPVTRHQMPFGLGYLG